jgi:Tol biopolymer transport system component
MDINGQNVQKLTEGNWSGWPIYSPNGLQILYLYQDINNGQRDLFLMNVDGSNKINLTNSDITPHNHSFSPDGQQIVFDGREKYPNNVISHVYLMNNDGSGLTRLTKNNQARNTYPKFSHDGKKIVYVSQSLEDGNWDLKIINTDGSNEAIILSDSVVIYDPMFTPDDKHIIYTSVFDSLSYSAHDLFIMDLSGENCRRLIEGMQGHWNHEANFSKDGTKLAFISNADMFITEINGENPINLTRSQELESWPQFIN